MSLFIKFSRIQSAQEQLCNDYVGLVGQWSRFKMKVLAVAQL